MFTLNAFKIVIYRQFIIFTPFIFRHLKSYPIRFLTPEEKALAQRVFGSLLDCERPKIIATALLTVASAWNFDGSKWEYICQSF